MARNNQIEVKAARDALENLKYEVASELGIDYRGYKGDLPSRVNGAVGGHMVKKMIQLAESHMANQQR